MSCGFDRELLSVYADGILEPERASQVEVHLSGCRECRRELEVLRGLGRALTSLPREQASSELLARILFQAEGRAHRTVLGVALRTAGAVWSVAFAPDGKAVVTGGVDGSVRLWPRGSCERAGHPFGCAALSALHPFGALKRVEGEGHEALTEVGRM